MEDKSDILTPLSLTLQMGGMDIPTLVEWLRDQKLLQIYGECEDCKLAIELRVPDGKSSRSQYTRCPDKLCKSNILRKRGQNYRFNSVFYSRNIDLKIQVLLLAYFAASKSLDDAASELAGRACAKTISTAYYEFRKYVNEYLKRTDTEKMGGETEVTPEEQAICDQYKTIANQATALHFLEREYYTEAREANSEQARPEPRAKKYDRLVTDAKPPALPAVGKGLFAGVPGRVAMVVEMDESTYVRFMHMQKNERHCCACAYTYTSMPKIDVVAQGCTRMYTYMHACNTCMHACMHALACMLKINIAARACTYTFQKPLLHVYA